MKPFEWILAGMVVLGSALSALAWPDNNELVLQSRIVVESLLFLLAAAFFRYKPNWHTALPLVGAALYHAANLLYLFEIIEFRLLLFMMQVSVGALGIVGIMAILDDTMPTIFRALLPAYCLLVGFEVFSINAVDQILLGIPILLLVIYFTANRYFRVKYASSYRLVILFALPVVWRLLHQL